MPFQSLILTSLPVLILGSSLLWPTASTQDQAARNRIQYTPTHRINAHGDEFNDLALSSDEQRLFIASERGESLFGISLRKRLSEVCDMNSRFIMWSLSETLAL